ncbi:uncharacterized protein G2W53_016234 [Senna tora]|uniref:Uncharacterized protein n=1 Tax=Senna tora TaxID=362788 RepID=A0A834TR51_9FABA|nr:uncharacterized protein G2W53_016234 [Senna tora]
MENGAGSFGEEEGWVKGWFRFGEEEGYGLAGKGNGLGLVRWVWWLVGKGMEDWKVLWVRRGRRGLRFGDMGDGGWFTVWWRGGMGRFGGGGGWVGLVVGWDGCGGWEGARGERRGNGLVGRWVVEVL